MGRKLWLFAGGAIAVVLAIILLGIFVPSFRDRSPLAVVVVVGIWAALSLLVLLAEARRIHKLLVLIALVLAAMLSFAASWFGFLAYLLAYYGVILFLVTVLVFGALRAFRKQMSLRALALPLTMTMMGSFGLLLCAWAAKPLPAIPEKAMNTSDELKYIYDTDQADRFTGRWLVDAGRDRVRLQRVKALYGAGRISAPMDHFHAAWVYQHANCADDFQVAYELAQGAVGPEVPEQHPPISHLAYDRWQLSLGKPQSYGTQLFPVPIKRPCGAGR